MTSTRHLTAYHTTLCHWEKWKIMELGAPLLKLSRTRPRYFTNRKQSFYNRSALEISILNWRVLRDQYWAQWLGFYRLTSMILGWREKLYFLLTIPPNKMKYTMLPYPRYRVKKHCLLNELKIGFVANSWTYIRRNPRN